MQNKIEQVTISTGIHVVDWQEIITAIIYDPTKYDYNKNNRLEIGE